MSEPHPAPPTETAGAQALLAQIFEQTPVAVFVKDLEGRYLFANRRFTQLFAAHCGEIAGRTDRDLFPPEAVAFLRANDRDAFGRSAPRTYEETLELPDGSRRTYVSLRFPLAEGGGPPRALCGVMTDITGRKRAEEALRRAAMAVSTAEGEAVFDHLVQSLSAVLGVEIAFIALPSPADPSRLRMLAFQVDGKTVDDFEYPMAGTPCETVIGQQLRVYPSSLLQLFPRDADFRRMGVESYAGHPLSDAHGRPLGLISVVSRQPLRDIALVESMLRIYAARAVTEIERRRAEVALRSSEEQYRAIFNASADALALWDSALRRVDVNPAYEHLYGYTREEVVGGAHEDHLPADYAERRREIVRRTLAGEACHVELDAIRKNGERFQIEVRTIPVRHRGEPHVLAVIRDITERKRAEAALRESEEQYRAVFNAAADALVLRDADFRVVEVNRTYMAMTERSRYEVIGVDRVIANPPEVDQRFRVLHQAALAGDPGVIETQLLRKDGSHFEVEVRAAPMQYRGAPHVLYMGRDITERKTSEARLRATVEAALDAIVVMDDAGHITEFNPAAEACFGFRRAAVLGQQLADVLIPERFREAHRRGLERYLQSGQGPFLGRRVEVFARRADGSEFSAELAIAPARGARGRIFIGYLRDITERRQAEAARAELEAQLRQAQKMEAIGQLSGGIAHDFNNILTGIMGYLALATENRAARADARLARHLNQAQLAAQRARDLIAQLLTFSRGRKGQPRPVALEALVEDALRLLGSSLPATLEVEPDFEPDLPRVMLDPVQLEQIVLNLCINARDAMGGSGRLRVGVRLVDDAAICASCRQNVEGRFVELFVVDDGAGIAPEIRERMFEPFFSTKEVGRGSGMGLATVHGIVHEHGGHIIVESTPGCGASFRVRFAPIAESAGGSGEAPHEQTSSAEARRALAGRVLVVDDEPMVGEVLAEMLSGWGLAVTVKRNPVEAQSWLAQAPVPPDLVITDQTMPRMTGLEFAARLSAQRPQVPVILCTGYAENLAADDVARSGVRAVIRKPVEPEALYAAVSEALGAAPGAEAVAPPPTPGARKQAKKSTKRTSSRPRRRTPRR